MQEKISQVMKMVTSFTKGKGITKGLNLREKPTSWKDNDPSAVSNLDNLCEQKKLRKDLSGQLEHINVQQRCSLLDKKLKVIKGMDDLESVDPRELSLVPDLVMPPKFKTPKFKKYDGTKCPENHLVTYCHKMVGHTRNEDLLIHVFYNSLIGTAAQWYMKLKKDQIRT